MTILMKEIAEETKISKAKLFEYFRPSFLIYNFNFIN